MELSRKQRIVKYLYEAPRPMADIYKQFSEITPAHLRQLMEQLRSESVVLKTSRNLFVALTENYQTIEELTRARRQRLVDVLAGQELTTPQIAERMPYGDRDRTKYDVLELRKRGYIRLIRRGVHTADYGCVVPVSYRSRKQLSEHKRVQHSKKVTFTAQTVNQIAATAKRLKQGNAQRKSDPITPRRQAYSAECQQRVLFRGQEKTCAGIENEKGNPLCPPCQDRAFAPHGFSDTSQGKWTGEKVEMI